MNPLEGLLLYCLFDHHLTTSYNMHTVLRDHVATTRSFGSLRVAEFDRKPTALEFMQLVAENRPAIFRNTDVDDWSAMESFMDRDRLCEMVQNNVKVAITPNGLADAVVDGTFCLPHEESMPLREFFDRLDAEDPNTPQSVHYIQSQNNNMREDGDFTKLFGEVPDNIDFATEALGAMPDAINFWCGSRHAVTSFHKDHYENIYTVITGTKIFSLIPPTESWALNERTFPTSQYVLNETTQSWSESPVFLDPDTYDITTDSTAGHPRMQTRWCGLNPTSEPDATTFRDRTGVPAGREYVRVVLERGDMLYLPALWAHRVEQGEGTVAVNYWYDFGFGRTWGASLLVRRLAAEAGVMEFDEEMGGEEEEEVVVSEEDLFRFAEMQNAVNGL
ncbi:hypothetical protein HDU98_000766 [Podochytrium sp. JEL0797]|nr:hypothetical protein HDU98_000766 [Podochytrium sp. JEL0797]